MISTIKHLGWHRNLRQATIILGVLVVAGTTLAAVHEEGVLKPATRALTAGDSLALKGENFTKNSPLTLQLVGIDGEWGDSRSPSPCGLFCGCTPLRICLG